MSASLIRLLAGVSEYVGGDVEAALDAVWLATMWSSATPRGTVASAASPITPSLTRTTIPPIEPPLRRDVANTHERLEASPDTPTRTRDSSPWVNIGLDRGTPADAVRVAIPRPPVLSETRRYVQSLRPLRLKGPGRRQRLCIEQTVLDIAASGIWDVSLEAVPEPVFDLVFLADSSGAWPLLVDGVRRLARILERLGAFRTVRTFLIEHRPDGLALRAGLASNHGPEVSACRLRDPHRRTLAFVVTDATGHGWWDDRVPDLLDALAPGRSLIVQTLPTNMWPMTGLRRHVDEAHLSLLTSGGDAVTLSYSAPVVEFNPTALATWARGWAAGRAQGGVRFPRGEGPREAPMAVVPARRVAHYLAHRSWPACRLAVLLSVLPSPAFTPHVIRLVREALIPGAGIVHEAEFFLGGLLAGADVGSLGAVIEPVFRFADGVAVELRRHATQAEVRSVVAAVSRWLERHWTQAGSFQAALYSGEQSARFSASGPFAEIARDLLDRFGPPRIRSRDKDGSVAPKERVNIRYRSGLHGFDDDIELPLRILVLGDFIGRPDSMHISERRPIKVDKDNFNRILVAQKLMVSVSVRDKLGGEDGAELATTVRFDGLADFRPEGFVYQIPALQELMVLRDALRAFITALGALPEFHKRLAAALEDPEMRARLLQEFGFGANGATDQRPVLEALLAAAEVDTAHLEVRSQVEIGIHRLVTELPGGSKFTRKIARDRVVELIADIDRRLTAQVNELMHEPQIMSLESSWRSLKYLVDEIDFRENIILEIVNISKDELAADFKGSSDIAQSSLYRIVYGEVFGAFAGRPYGVLCATYELDADVEDMEMLTRCSNVAAISHAPFLANAAPEMFGVASHVDVPAIRDLATVFEHPRYTHWSSLRDTADARYVGLCLPRFLLRAPYGIRESELLVRNFHFTEDVIDQNEHYLWGPASIAITAKIADSFAKYRWCPNIIGPLGGGAVRNLPLHEYEQDGKIKTKLPCESLIFDRREYELSEQGFICLSALGGSNNAAFFSANSAQRPKLFPRNDEGLKAQINFTLGTRLPYMFIISRFAHYLKLLQREQIGTWQTRSDLERELNTWLRQYISDMPDPPPGVRSRKPLRNALVTVKGAEGQDDYYYRFHLRIEPHIRFEGDSFTLSLDGKLETMR